MSVGLMAKGPRFEKSETFLMLFLLLSVFRRSEERVLLHSGGIMENLAKYGMWEIAKMLARMILFLSEVDGEVLILLQALPINGRRWFQFAKSSSKCDRMIPR